ncbi:MAG: type II toxin-antitoxin system RelE/ParE family toxin [Oscillospiraceae bacterium]|nr:type II toxin-antitoxin system RelE/ParE family toxin [Oscillospiraceae bacterium]
MFEIQLYETESGRAPVGEYLRKLASEAKTKELAQIRLFTDRLEEYGMAVNNKYPETIRKLRDDVYELRPGPNRVFFFYFTGRTFVLLHAYRKHGQKAPPSEIRKAVSEMKDHIRRNQK